MNAPYDHRRCCPVHGGCCGWCAPCICCKCFDQEKGASEIDGDFREHIESLQIGAGESFTDTIPTHNARTITVFVKNTGEGPITVSLQNSPNGLDFTDDPQLLELHAAKTGYLVPYIFSKYTRARAVSAAPGAATIWFQMQNHSYFQHPA